MLLKRGPLTANIDVHIRYTFEPVEHATCVIRTLDLTIQIPGLLNVAEPLVASAFRKENVRILAELKRYVEAQPYAIVRQSTNICSGSSKSACSCDRNITMVP